MTIMKTTYLALLCLAIGGCSASNVNTSGPERQPYAPSNDDSSLSDGEISYLNGGAKRVRNARRDDAYKKMFAHCGGPYVIVREEDQQGANIGGPQRRIWFRCEKKGAG